MIFSYGQIGNPRFQKSEISKFRDLQTSVFSIFTHSQIRKLGLQKIRDFQRSEFSIFAYRFSNTIFAYSQIRKLGLKKSEISKRPAEYPAFFPDSLIFKYKNLDLSESNHLWSLLESQCPSIHSFYFYPKAKYENLYLALYENIRSWKCRRRKILQADSAGRVRLKLIRDFSDLQPREVITILAILFGKSRSHLSKKSAMTYLKQILHKTSELLFYQNENWLKTRKA